MRETCVHAEYCSVLVDCPSVSCGLWEFMDAVRAWGVVHNVSGDYGSRDDRARIAIGITEVYCEVCGFDHRAPDLETTLFHTVTGLRCDPIEVEERANAARKRGQPPQDVLKPYRYGPPGPTRLTTMVKECLRRCHERDPDQSDTISKETSRLSGGATLDTELLETELRPTIP